MLMKVAVVFFVFALVAAVAGSIPATGPVYRVTLTEPASVNGTALKAGEYRVAVTGGKAMFVLGKESHEVAVKVEEAAKKFDGNRIQFCGRRQKLQPLEAAFDVTQKRQAEGPSVGDHAAQQVHSFLPGSCS